MTQYPGMDTAADELGRKLGEFQESKIKLTAGVNFSLGGYLYYVKKEKKGIFTVKIVSVDPNEHRPIEHRWKTRVGDDMVIAGYSYRILSTIGQAIFRIKRIKEKS